MFLKNREGMEVLQVVILGLLLVALGVLFVSKFQQGVKAAGGQVNNAASTAGNTLTDAVVDITGPGAGD